MLRLKSVKIDGFMSYGSTGEIVLDLPGITHICGKTGSGKSCIFEVIHYLLTGDTLREKGVVKNLINKVIGKGYDISIKYQNNDHLYEVQEIRGRGKTDGLFFRVDGELKLGSKTGETRNYILESLGMTKGDFCSVAFLGQNQSQILIDGTSEERFKEIVRIFGLDKYDESLKECDKDLKEISSIRKEINEKIESYSVDLIKMKESISFSENVQPEDVELEEEQIRQRLADLGYIE